MLEDLDWPLLQVRRLRTSNPKGNDRSPVSNVPRSNVVFSAFKANHSTWPIKQVLKKKQIF